MQSEKLFKITLLASLITILSFFAVSAQTVKLYPSTLRIEKGKSKTVTALAFDGSGVYIPNQTFTFSTGNPNIITATRSAEGNQWSPPSSLSKNLADVWTQSTAGTTTVTATLNGINSNAVTVLVDDPAASPTAVIHGDNDASGGGSITAKVGEPIEVNAESSLGVKTIEWSWGDGDSTTELLSSSHAYLVAGNYTLQLTVKNLNGTTATSSVAVTIQNHIACDGSNTINVNSISALQTAYDGLTSAGGKCLLLAPGIYDGNLVLAPKNFSEYVLIGTTGTLPNIKNRIAPDSSSLVTIRSALRATAAVQVLNGVTGGNKAGKLRFSGIKFEPKHDDWTTDIDAYYIVTVGDYELTTNIAHNPEKVIFQHCVMNPPNNIEVAHGILNNGYKVAMISNWFGNIKTRSAGDSQAVFGISGRGAHVYNNNFLEAGSENIMYGGTGCITNGCTIDGVVPSNIELRRNFFTKRLSWRTDYVYGEISVKNLFETKSARRIYAEGNIFKNHWDDGENQAHVFVFKSSIGSGSGGYLWNVSEDIVFENNRISHIQGGIGTARDRDNSSLPGPRKVSNIRFKNNVFDDASVERFGAPSGRAWFIAQQGVEDLILDHVTMIDPRDNVASNGERALYIDDITNYRLKITNSIIALNEYGFSGTCGSGIAVLVRGAGGGVPDPCTPSLAASWTVSSNILPKIGSHNLNDYPSGNTYPENYSGVGLANYVFCNTTESCDQPISNFECTGSPCNNAGSDGKDIGADIPLVAQRTACSESGVGTNCGGGGNPTQLPHPGPGVPNVPVTLEAENFDKGGEGLGYHELTGNTGSGAYRSSPVEAVDIQVRSTASNGYAVFEASAGEWLEFTVNVPFTRKFDLGVRYSSEFNNGKVRILDCGTDPQNQTCSSPVDLTGQLTLNSTGNWANFRVVSARNIQLTAGTHVLRLLMDANSSDGCACVVGNIDAMLFESSLFDYDNDGRADTTVFRPSDATWYIDRSSAGFTAQVFGFGTDIVTPGDFDGDGKADVAVFRPSAGDWYIYNSSNGQVSFVHFGANGDIPVQADYDGDGKTDIAVWRPSDGTWYRLNSSNGSYFGFAFGMNGDRPAVGDYDGDGKNDLAVFRPSIGQWFVYRSSDSVTLYYTFGLGTDKIVPGDYDGDGKTEIAVWRPSTGDWHWLSSINGQYSGLHFGSTGDMPVPADFDADGKTDLAVFRPSTGGWYQLRSTEGYAGPVFGLSADVPIPSTYVR